MCRCMTRNHEGIPVCTAQVVCFDCEEKLRKIVLSDGVLDKFNKKGGGVRYEAVLLHSPDQKPIYIKATAKPDGVWFWNHGTHNPPATHLTSIPQGSARHEDPMHDWKWSHGQIKYHGIGVHSPNPFWLLLQYGNGPEPLKKCISCGKDIQESSVFCPDCGTRQPIKKASNGIKALMAGVKGFNLDALPLATAPGFKTGSPVTFTYMRNPEKAPNMGSRFGQDIEPAGFYVLAADNDSIAESAKASGWIVGSMAFSKPLVLTWGGYGPDGWKQQLSNACGGRKKGSLTRFLLSQGFDGIVTVMRGETSEIVSLKGTSAVRTASGGVARYGIHSIENLYQRFGMKTATKTPGEKEDEEIERLSRPATKKGPPRHDLRRERIKEHDPDFDGDKNDTTKDPDLSMNYKKVALDAYYDRIADIAIRVIKAEGATSSKPPASPPKPPVTPKVPEHKPGEVWQPEGSETWSGKNQEGESRGGFKDKDSAKAYATGESSKLEKEKGQEDSELNIGELGIPNKAGEMALQQRLKDLISGEGLSRKDVEKNLKNELKTLREAGFLDFAHAHKFFSAADEQKLTRRILDEAARLHPEWDEGTKKPSETSPEQSGQSEQGVEEPSKTPSEKTVTTKKTKPAPKPEKLLKDFELSDTAENDEQLMSRSKAAIDHFIQGSTEDREDVAVQLAEAFKVTKETDPKYAQLKATLDALKVVAALNDEEYSGEPPSEDEGEGGKSGKPLVPKAAPMGAALIKAMYRTGNTEMLFKSGDEGIFAKFPKNREFLLGAMDTLSDGEVHEVLGGSDGPYNNLIETWNTGTPEQRKLASDFLKKCAVDNMTLAYDLLSAEVDKADRKNKKVPATKKQDAAERLEKANNDPSVLEARREFANSIIAGGDSVEAEKKARLAPFAVIVKEIQSMNPDHEDEPNPLLLQAQDALERNDPEALEIEYRLKDKKEEKHKTPKLKEKTPSEQAETQTTQVPKTPKTGRLQLSLSDFQYLGNNHTYQCGGLQGAQLFVCPHVGQKLGGSQMSKATKKGALAVAAAHDQLANLYQTDYAALGIPARIAMDFAYRNDLLADYIMREAGINPKNAQFNPAEIGVGVSGPSEFDADEPWMKGEFTQQENRELREDQEGGDLGFKVVDGPQAGKQASFEVMGRRAAVRQVVAAEKTVHEAALNVAGSKNRSLVAGLTNLAASLMRIQAGIISGTASATKVASVLNTVSKIMPHVAAAEVEDDEDEVKKVARMISIALKVAKKAEEDEEVVEDDEDAEVEEKAKKGKKAKKADDDAEGDTEVVEDDEEVEVKEKGKKGKKAGEVPEAFKKQWDKNKDDEDDKDEKKEGKKAHNFNLFAK